MSEAPDSPVIRYHGGKFRLAPWIVSFFPPHATYVEPFGGAASVLMQKPRSYAEVYNDRDDEVVNLFSVLRDGLAYRALRDQLALTPYARSEFEAAFKLAEDRVEQARRTIIKACMGFGSAGATKSKTGFRSDSKRTGGTSASVWTSYQEKLDQFHQRLQGVIIENSDASDVIAKHDGPETLVYVDPPYPHGTRESGHYYRHELTNDQHADLLGQLRAIDGMVVISSYRNPLYDDMLSDWSRFDLRTTKGANRGGRYQTESIWLNPYCNAQHCRPDLFEGLDNEIF